MTPRTVQTPPDPRVVAAREVAADVLTPRASRVEQEGVRRDAIDRVGAAGLLGLVGPAEAGGSDAPPAVTRAVAEELAGACLSTWFVQAQHHSPVRLLRAAPDSPPARRWLAALCEGRTLAGVAFSHLRRRPAAPVRATPAGDGWRLDGVAPWVTGWGLSDLLVIGGLTPADEIVWVLVPAREQVGLHAGAPLRLAALGGAGTVALHLDGLAAGPQDVIARVPWPRWATADADATSDASPAVFGLARAALALLDAGTPEAARAGVALRTRVEAARERCYRLADEQAPHAERLLARADASRLLVELASTAVVAGGGRAMGLDHPAQRLAREALFLQVQAQTHALRAVQLAAATPHPQW